MVSRLNSESMEDYLETIAILSKDRPVVRVSEISRALDVKMPSVTAAIKKLSEEGLVEHEKYGYIRLTRKGSTIAKDMLYRHETLQHFLKDIIGVDAETAETDACRIEHAISTVTLERLSKFVEFVSMCPAGQPEWLKGFEYYFEKGEHSDDCLARCQTNT